MLHDSFIDLGNKHYYTYSSDIHINLHKFTAVKNFTLYAIPCIDDFLDNNKNQTVNREYTKNKRSINETSRRRK